MPSGRGTVFEQRPPDMSASGHEGVTCTDLARRIAALLDYAFGGDHRPGGACPGHAYFVPRRTLTGATARGLRIESEADLFGGVVPRPFVATKAITHELVDPDAAAPEGWSPDFGREVRDAVLAGYSAFTMADAQRAGRLLLQRGPARLKPVRATGGRGQSVVEDISALDAALATIDAAELAEAGLVLEENLSDVVTYSVGQIRIGDLTASYFGTQLLTPDNLGEEVYGGSELVVAQGSFEDLLRLAMPEGARLAVAQARAYDAAATRHFPGFFASRRNYDVAAGANASRERRSGVLEQSWRIGGASGAEIAALEAFRAQPERRAVRASCFEVYGAGREPPARAVVSFSGEDETVGEITKYTTVEDHDHA
jgi:hypothetical protein